MVQDRCDRKQTLQTQNIISVGGGGGVGVVQDRRDRKQTLQKLLLLVLAEQE